MSLSLLESGAIRLRPDFLHDSHKLFEHLTHAIAWDTRFRARQMASFGLPYNYSGVVWPVSPFPESVGRLLPLVAAEVGFEPNNCLANFYPDGEASMGFHSDATDELAPNTGIAVLSLGAERTITFRRHDKTASESHALPSGSLLWMCLGMQADWRHAVLADKAVAGGRISLTFRLMKTSPGSTHAG
ncbi:MAG: alpha-ketoglutarate-dependent dioxygenase AlkB [Gemmataceae bacterium]|nr:alpha-ketoglutarate-dependent dioxygenase AlkB [Gemmataceae bacterium]